MCNEVYSWCCIHIVLLHSADQAKLSIYSELNHAADFKFIDYNESLDMWKNIGIYYEI